MVAALRALYDAVEALDTSRYVLHEGLRADRVDASGAVDVELCAGDLSIGDPRIVHGSNAPTSDRRRTGLTLRYAPTSTRIANPGHRGILLRGAADPTIPNAYAEQPAFDPARHMAFAGCEGWS